jgi:hypothetical protein
MKLEFICFEFATCDRVWNFAEWIKRMYNNPWKMSDSDSEDSCEHCCNSQDTFKCTNCGSITCSDCSSQCTGPGCYEDICGKCNPECEQCHDECLYRCESCMNSIDPTMCNLCAQCDECQDSSDTKNILLCGTSFRLCGECIENIIQRLIQLQLK